MQRKDVLKLAEILSEWIKDSNLESRLNNLSVEEAFREIVGERMMCYVTSVYAKEGMLFVKFSSSVFRQEMQMNKRLLIERINKEIAIPYLKDIVFR